MVKLLRNNDFSGVGLFLLLFVLACFQYYIAPAIGVFLIILLLDIFVFKTVTFKPDKHNLWFVVLFGLYLLGILWSDHPDLGWKLLEYKMSFFIFPIIFLFNRGDRNPWLILQGFVWGCFGLMLQFFYFRFFGAGQNLSFYDISRELVLIHPTYTSIYFTISACIIVLGLKSLSDRSTRFLYAGMIPFFLLTIYLIGSFAAILFLLILIAVCAGYLIYRFFGKFALFGYLIALPVIGYLTVPKIDAIQYDLEMLNAVRKEISGGKVNYLQQNKAVISGTKERVMLWIISAEIIAENPFGVGTGDIDFALAEKCKKYDLDLLKSLSLNPHNQFLQIGIDIGYLGVLGLLLLIGFSFRLAWKARNYVLMVVLFSLVFNGLFESVLQRQSGIVFYSLIITLAIHFNTRLGKIN